MEMTQAIEILCCGRHVLIYHDSGCPGDKRSQGINNHVTDWILLEYFGFITRRIKKDHKNYQLGWHTVPVPLSHAIDTFRFKITWKLYVCSVTTPGLYVNIMSADALASRVTKSWSGMVFIVCYRHLIVFLEGRLPPPAAFFKMQIHICIFSEQFQYKWQTIRVHVKASKWAPVHHYLFHNKVESVFH